MPDGTHRLVVPVADAAITLNGQPVPDPDLLDVIGDTEVVIRLLRDFVGMLKSELPDKAATPRYREAGGRSAARSYNTEKILARLMGASDMDPGANLFDAIRLALDRDALRLTWRWTELKGLYETLDLPMTIVRHEIEDGDLDADVGEVWTTATKVEAVPDAG